MSERSSLSLGGEGTSEHFGQLVRKPPGNPHCGSVCEIIGLYILWKKNTEELFEMKED